MQPATASNNVSAKTITTRPATSAGATGIRPSHSVRAAPLAGNTIPEKLKTIIRYSVSKGRF